MSDSDGQHMTTPELPLRAVPDRFMNARELAEYMRCSKSTIWRMKREGMPFHNWGRRLVVFSPSEAVEWAMSREASK